MDSDTPHTLDEELEEEYNNFPFVKWRKHVKKTFKKLKGWLVNPRFDDGSYPMLVTSFRGHLGGVVSLDLAELPMKLLIISASGDQSIRLWSISGDFLGIFGAKNWWIGVDSDGLKKQPLTQKIRKSKTNEYNVYGKRRDKLEDQIQSIPSDIKRVASATTLRVLHSGDSEYKFKLTTMVLRWIGKMAAKSFTKTMTRNLLGTDKKPETMSIPNVSQMKLEKESVGKSKILKGGYKKTTRHRRLPVIPIVTRNPFTESVSVFGSLPYCELDPVPTIAMPETMKEILQRNAAMQQAKDAEKAKLKGTAMRRASHVAAGARHSRRGTSSLSKRRESFSPKTSPGPSRGSSATPETNVAPNSSKGSAKRLSNRIEEVLERTSSALKMTKLPPINQKNGDTRMDAARNKVVKKLKANRDTYELGA